MSMQIINPSFFTTIQDRGRFGYNNIGVTNSGVSDEFAYNVANMLLNDKDISVLEISYSNFEAKFHKNTQIAICGAKALVLLNGEKIKLWQTHNIKSGDTLKIGKFESGAKLYFALKGGFILQKEFGSYSTSIKEGLGGLDGGFLKKGDILDYKPFISSHKHRLKEEYIPNYEQKLTLRVVLSYQDRYFIKSEIDKFFSSEFTVTNDFNKMACKLSGESIKSSLDGILSEGIVFGSIQIPKDGQAIILLKERQTIGGYPKIGVVLGIDCFRLSQVKVNTKIRFKQINFQEATSLQKKFYNSFISSNTYA